MNEFLRKLFSSDFMPHGWRDGETIVVSSRWPLQHGDPDITERKRAGENLVSMQNRLANIARVTTRGELAASIAHEIDQPLAAVVTKGNACLRWMTLAEPNLDEARDSVTARIRAFITKSPPRMSPLEINGLAREAHRNKVVLRAESAGDMAAVVGDRVLPLAISRSTNQSHGGRLWAASNPDRRATFQFRLPAPISVPAA